MSETHSCSEEERPICDYEGSRYRTDFWEGRGRTYEDRVERHALRQLLPAGGRRLLDVGAGFGRLADMYAGYQEVVLFDYSRSQLEYARARLGDERFVYVAGDIYRMPLAGNAVDAAVMVRVLHHLVDVPAALAHLARVLCPQGTLVLEFANKRHLKNMLRYALGKGVNPFERAPYEFAALHFDFHPAWVAQQLTRAGFEIHARRSVSLFRSQALKRILPVPFLVMMDGLLQRAAAPLALGPSMFLCAKSQKGGQEGPAEELLFRCPSCGYEPLMPGEQGVECSRCHALWPIENGIYLFK